jgi:beta-glucosidase
LSGKLSLKQKIGQMIVVRGAGYLFDHQRRYPQWEAPNFQLQKWLEELNLGGVILLGGSGAEIYLKTQQLQKYAQTPLLIAADIEEGVGQRFAGATHFPPPMALGEIYQKNPLQAREWAYKMGKVTAQEALALGINWILAPVMDVNNNPHNPVINVRAFGENPQIVGELGSAFIKGAKNYPVLTTAKHFPGHGDTSTDSHLELPILHHNQERLDNIEIPPFISAIQSGVDGIMTAHLMIPEWDTQYPATLSYKILTENLRNKLKFSGLIVTDALIMGGVANHFSPEDLAVKVVEGGADILLMPENPEIAINAIEKAVISGKISEERINDSFTKITQSKSKLNFGYSSFKGEEIAQDGARETVNLILKNSQKNQGNLRIKVEKKKEEKINLIYVDSFLNQDFLASYNPAITIPRELGYKLKLIAPDHLISLTEMDQPFILQIFLRGNPFRGRAGLSNEIKQYLQKICKINQLQGIIIYGSPYIFDWFCEEINPKTPCIFSYGQFDTAQKIALESLFDLPQEINNYKGEFI